MPNRNRNRVSKRSIGGTAIATASPPPLEGELLRDDTTTGRIEELPRDVGWMLFGVGFAGFVAPGIFGLPFMAAGGMILWPKTSKRLQRLVGWRSARDIPPAGMKQVVRFLNDLERRYPAINKP